MPLVSSVILKWKYLTSNTIPCKITLPVKYKNCLRGTNNGKSSRHAPCKSQSLNQGSREEFSPQGTTSLYCQLWRKGPPSQVSHLLKSQSMVYEELDFLLRDKTLRAQHKANAVIQQHSLWRNIGFLFTWMKKGLWRDAVYLSQLHRRMNFQWKPCESTCLMFLFNKTIWSPKERLNEEVYLGLWVELKKSVHILPEGESCSDLSLLDTAPPSLPFSRH